jgi:hypothetical protein
MKIFIGAATSGFVQDWIQHGHLCGGEGVLEVIVNQRLLMVLL